MIHPLREQIEHLHTTELGFLRIQKNPKAIITRNGKNWYVKYYDCVITIHAHSHTIITAHRCL